MKRSGFLSTASFTILVLFIFIFSSCKKDSTGGGGTYQMSFTANGTKVEYTLEGALVATFSNAGQQYVGIFSGYDTNTNMNLQVYDNTDISEKGYSGYTTVNTELVGVLMGYKDNSSTLYSKGGGDVVVNVSSITDTSVSGTFSGTLKAAGKPDMVIADGKFTVKRIN